MDLQEDYSSDPQHDSNSSSSPIDHDWIDASDAIHEHEEDCLIIDCEDGQMVLRNDRECSQTSDYPVSFHDAPSPGRMIGGPPQINFGYLDQIRSASLSVAGVGNAEVGDELSELRQEIENNHAADRMDELNRSTCFALANGIENADKDTEEVGNNEFTNLPESSGCGCEIPLQTPELKTEEFGHSRNTLNLSADYPCSLDNRLPSREHSIFGSVDTLTSQGAIDGHMIECCLWDQSIPDREDVHDQIDCSREVDISKEASFYNEALPSKCHTCTQQDDQQDDLQSEHVLTPSFDSSSVQNASSNSESVPPFLVENHCADREDLNGAAVESVVNHFVEQERQNDIELLNDNQQDSTLPLQQERSVSTLGSSSMQHLMHLETPPPLPSVSTRKTSIRGYLTYLFVLVVVMSAFQRMDHLKVIVATSDQQSWNWIHLALKTHCESFGELCESTDNTSFVFPKGKFTRANVSVSLMPPLDCERANCVSAHTVLDKSAVPTLANHYFVIGRVRPSRGIDRDRSKGHASHFTEDFLLNESKRLRSGITVLLVNGTCADWRELLNEKDHRDTCEEGGAGRSELFNRFIQNQMCKKAGFSPGVVFFDIEDTSKTEPLQVLTNTSKNLASATCNGIVTPDKTLHDVSGSTRYEWEKGNSRFNSLSGHDATNQSNVESTMDEVESEFCRTGNAVRKAVENTRYLQDILDNSAKKMIEDESLKCADEFGKFTFMVFGLVGSGKTTLLYWLSRHAGAPEDVCMKFPNRKASSDQAHTTLFTGTNVKGTRMFDTAGLRTLTKQTAFGVKLVASGYQKEGFDIKYVSQPKESLLDTFCQSPHVSQEEVTNLNHTALMATKAHAVLLMLKYSANYTQEELNRMREFLDELKRPQQMAWRTDVWTGWAQLWKTNTWTLHGFEPIVAVTHLDDCEDADRTSCVAALASGLGLSSDEMFPLDLADSESCRRHAEASSRIGGTDYARHCERAFIPPGQQLADILVALQAKARVFYSQFCHRHV